MEEKKSRFGLGMIIGLLTGVFGGIFMSEKPGRQLRQNTKKKVRQIKKFVDKKDPDEIVMEIFGSVTDNTRALYKKSTSLLASKIIPYKKRISKLDRQKYTSIVDEVISRLEEDKQIVQQTAIKLKKYLIDDYNNLMKSSQTRITARRSAKKIIVI